MLWLTVAIPKEYLSNLFTYLEEHYPKEVIEIILNHYKEEEGYAYESVLFVENGTIKLDVERIKEVWQIYPDLKTAISQCLAEHEAEHEENKIMSSLEKESRVELMWGFSVYLVNRQFLVHNKWN